MPVTSVCHFGLNILRRAREQICAELTSSGECQPLHHYRFFLCHLFLPLLLYVFTCSALTEPKTPAVSLTPRFYCIYVLSGYASSWLTRASSQFFSRDLKQAAYFVKVFLWLTFSCCRGELHTAAAFVQLAPSYKNGVIVLYQHMSAVLFKLPSFRQTISISLLNRA